MPDVSAEEERSDWKVKPPAVDVTPEEAPADQGQAEEPQQWRICWRHESGNACRPSRGWPNDEGKPTGEVDERTGSEERKAASLNGRRNFERHKERKSEEDRTRNILNDGK